MFNGRSIEFFEGDNGRLSMTRLLCWMAFYPACVALFQIESENALLYFLGAFVLQYIGGKGADAFMKNKPQQEMTETTTRTVSKAPTDEIPAKDVSIKAEGDVTVNKPKRRK